MANYLFVWNQDKASMKYSLIIVYVMLFIVPLTVSATDSASSVTGKVPYNPKADYVASLPHSDSHWDVAIRSRYTNILSGKKQDILVLPFQVKQHAIDKIGRGLMTRYLVATLEERLQQSLVNPSLIERYLGENKRRYTEDAIIDLLRVLNVKTLITGYVGHNNQGKFSVTIRIQHKQKLPLSPDAPHSQFDWDNIPFSDTELPSDQFRLIVDAIADKILPHVESYQPILKSNHTSISDLPKSLSKLIEGAQVLPIEQATILQLIGILHPTTSNRKKERLFERSLVALRHESITNPDIARLRARAFYYLHRRPAALNLMHHPNSDNDKLLLAVLNGNLPALKSTLKQFNHSRNAIEKLISTLQYNKFFYSYNKELDKSTLLTLENLNDIWQFYAGRAFIDPDKWRVFSNSQTKYLLDSHFPLQEFTIEKLYGKRIKKGKMPEEYEFSNHTVAHLDKYSELNNHKLCCTSNSWQLSSLDNFELLEAIAESNVIKTLYIKRKLTAKPKETKRLADKLRMSYQDHPAYMILGGLMENQNSDIMSKIQLKTALLQDAEERKKVFYEIAGQTKIAARVFRQQHNIMTFDPKKNRKEDGVESLTEHSMIRSTLSDFPQRDYWLDNTPNTYISLNRKALENALLYTSSDFKIAKRLHDVLPDNEKNAFRKSLKSRFDGSKEKLLFLSKFDNNGKSTGNDALLATATKNNSVHWEIFHTLGDRLVHQGKYKQAHKAFMDYPPFSHTSSVSHVTLSNHAYQAGSYLFWRGAYELAKSFYSISSNYNTYSNAGLASKVRLAILDNNFKKAAEFSRKRAKRYKNSYAYRDYITLMSVLGNQKDIEDLFHTRMEKSIKPHIWTAAYVKQRFENQSQKFIIEWFSQEKFKQKEWDFTPLAERYSALALLTDRKVTKTTLAYYQDVSEIELERNPVRKTMIQLIKLYMALKQQDFGKAKSLWPDRKNDKYFKNTYLRQFLPYVVYAYSKEHSNPYILDLLAIFKLQMETIKKKRGKPFDGAAFNYYLAMAFHKGMQGDVEQSLAHIQKAFNHRVHTDARYVFTWYQLVEACEWLYQATNDEAYKKLALKWAKQYQIIQPWFAWAYGVEAKYTKDPLAKQRAVALTLYLDKQSEHIADLSDAERAAAEVWLKNNNPFESHTPSHKTKTQLSRLVIDIFETHLLN